MSLPQPKIKALEFEGVTHYVRALNGKGRREFRALSNEYKDKGGIGESEMAAMGLCDEAGVLKYDWKNPEHIAQLDAADGGFLEQVSTRFMDLSGLSTKADEQAEKN